MYSQLSGGGGGKGLSIKEERFSFLNLAFFLTQSRRGEGGDLSGLSTKKNNLFYLRLSLLEREGGINDYVCTAPLKKLFF